MQRPIKFRAWDIDNKQMSQPFSWLALASGQFDQRTLEAMNLLQYTGLKDKDGVEIYEGDLLRLPAKNEHEKSTYNSFEVFWHDNDATPTDCGLVLGRLTAHGNSAGGYSGYKLIPKDISTMEVIGNVHENPELLDVRPLKTA